METQELHRGRLIDHIGLVIRDRERPSYGGCIPPGCIGPWWKGQWRSR